MFKESGKIEDKELKNSLESVSAESQLLDTQLYAAWKRAWLSQQEIAQTLQNINSKQETVQNSPEYREVIEQTKIETNELKTSALISATNLNKETWIIDTQNIIQLPIYNT
jgi:hypothetical protein